MRWLLRIFLIISVALNGYFIFDEIRFRQREEFAKIFNQTMGGDISKTTWQQGLELFTTKLKKNNKGLIDKKYYYINIWTTWCIPCIKEMPWLDSTAGTLNKDVGYVFLSDIGDEAAMNCIKRKRYNIKNFIFLNDMNDFISSICNERKRTTKVYPMVLILNNKGELLHFSEGAYENAAEAKEFADLINKLD